MKWREDFNYVFDNNQAPGKVEFLFTQNYLGIKYVVVKKDKCFVIFEKSEHSDKKQISIPCVASNLAISFGIL